MKWIKRDWRDTGSRASFGPKGVFKLEVAQTGACEYGINVFGIAFDNVHPDEHSAQRAAIESARRILQRGLDELERERRNE